METQISKKSITTNLIKNLFFGLFALFAAFWFMFNLIRNPYNEFLLITKGITTDGYIIKANEFEDVVEPEGRPAEQVYHVSYEYTFSTRDGKMIKSVGQEDSPEPGYLQESNKNRIKVQVEYLSGNPDINRVKDMGNQCKSLFEFIWRRLLLGAVLLIMLSSLGILLIRNGIKKYIIDKKNIMTGIIR